jgi:hypothetical protein
VLPRLFSEAERASFEALPDGAPRAARTPAERVVYEAKDRASREHIQAESLQRLARALPVTPSFLPLLFDDAATPAALRELSKRV